MTDDSEFHVPEGKWNQLKYSIGNLLEEWANTDNPILGLVINLGMAAIGVVVWYFTSGIVAFAGGVWAILSILAIVKWVLGL